MIWVAANDMDAGREILDVSPSTFNFWGTSLHILTVLDVIPKNLLRDTPIILFRKLKLGII